MIDNANSVSRWIDFHGTLVLAGYPKHRIVAAGSALKMKAFVINTAIAVRSHCKMNLNYPGNKQIENYDDGNAQFVDCTMSLRKEKRILPSNVDC